MKNQDMPAMPVFNSEGFISHAGEELEIDPRRTGGFTKREQVFKDILCALIASSDIANEAGVLRESEADDLMINADMLTNMYFRELEL